MMAGKVLIVDDSLLIRKVVNQTFSRLGIVTIEATDGREALKCLDQHYTEIALIFTDWNMPNMNGYELLQHIKSNRKFKEIPVILVTSETEKGNINKALNGGAADYIIKPFNGQDLLKIAASHMK